MSNTPQSVLIQKLNQSCKQTTLLKVIHTQKPTQSCKQILLKASDTHGPTRQGNEQGSQRGAEGREKDQGLQLMQLVTVYSRRGKSMATRATLRFSERRPATPETNSEPRSAWGQSVSHSQR